MGCSKCEFNRPISPSDGHIRSATACNDRAWIEGFLKARGGECFVFRETSDERISSGSPGAESYGERH